MSLSAGTRLGVDEVTGPLAAGAAAERTRP
jgi:hypothetical protein